MREPPGPVKKPRGWGFGVIRPAGHFVLHVVAAAIAAAAIVFAAAAWRLASGPVTLTFLSPYIEDALRESDAPYRVEFSDTILAWTGWERTLDIRLLDVRAVGADGALAAVAPEVSLGLSLPALLRGMIAPSSLEIIEPKVRVVRGPDGSIELGLGAEAVAAGSPADLLLADLLAPPDPSRAMGYLARVSIVDADLVVDDRRLGMSWHAPHATVTLVRDADGVAAEATLDVDIAGNSAAITARGRYARADGTLSARLEFADVQPQWLGQSVPGLERLSAVQVPVSGTLDVALGADGAVSQVVFDLSAGAGRVALLDWFEGEFDVAVARAKGVFLVGARRLQLDDAFVDLGGPTLTGEVLIEGVDDQPLILGGATLRDVPLDDLRRYWPTGLAPQAREWIVSNLTDGVIRTGKASIQIRPGDLDGGVLPEEAIVATLDLEGVTVNYRDPLPKLAGVDGHVTITGKRVEITTSGGRLEGLRAGEGLLVIDDIGGAATMSIDVAAGGPVRDAMELLAHPYLGYAQEFGIDPAGVGGSAKARLRFDFPLVGEATGERFDFAVDAELREVSVSSAIEGYELSGGTLSLMLDPKRLDVSGSVALNGVPADVALHEDLSDNALESRSRRVAGRFTDSQRRALGFPGNEYVAGPTDIEVEIVDRLDGQRRWRVSASLVDAVVRIPEIRWQKPAGVDGHIEIEARSAPGKAVIVDSLRLAAGDLVATGRAEFDAESGVLRRLELDRLQFGATDVQAKVEAIEGGGHRVTLGGASLDLRPYLEDAFDGGGDASAAPLDLSARLDRLIVREGYAITGIDASLLREGDRWEQLALDGALGDEKRVSLRLSRTPDGRALWMGSDDAGALLRALDVFDNAVGGKLALTASLDGDGREDAAIGELKIANFKMLNAPVLAKVLSVASLFGVIDALKGEGLPFTRLIVPYTKRGDVLTIKDARAYGPALGFTLEGEVDLAADTVDMKGTLVPAYTLNSVFGKLPILGKILAGPKGGGLFAASYRISGPLDDPKIVVNPLSAFAPGVLRGVFSFVGKDEDEVEPFNNMAPDPSR